MPTINLEMMKQLLQEFSEKEALTTEEIGVIEAEILNLETRIESCRTKLKNLNSDKDKLSGMQQRYASGNFSLRSLNDRIPQGTNTQASAIVSETPEIAPVAPQPESANEAPDSIDSKSTKAKKQKETLAESEQTSQQNQSENLINEKENSDNVETANTSTETKSADNKDTGDGIKSLNDALKGLFRK